MPQWVRSTNLVHPHEVLPAGRGFNLKTVEEVTRLDTVQDELNVRTGILHPENTSVRVMWCSGCGHVLKSVVWSPTVSWQWVWSPKQCSHVMQIGCGHMMQSGCGHASCGRRLDTAHNSLCTGSVQTWQYLYFKLKQFHPGWHSKCNFFEIHQEMSECLCQRYRVMWYGEQSTTDW